VWLPEAFFFSWGSRSPSLFIMFNEYRGSDPFERLNSGYDFDVILTTNHKLKTTNYFSRPPFIYSNREWI